MRAAASVAPEFLFLAVFRLIAIVLWPLHHGSKPNPLPLTGEEDFFGVFECPAQPGGSHALGPLALGAAKQFLAGIGERPLHDQIPINIEINTQQRLQVIDCAPSG